MIKKIVFLLTSSLLFLSCSQTKMLTRSLQSVKVPISYLHDSDIIENDKIKTIALDNIDIQFIDSTTTVTLTNRLILPLIFYYYFDRKYDITC